jgi:hypothetical protein
MTHKWFKHNKHNPQPLESHIVLLALPLQPPQPLESQ